MKALWGGGKEGRVLFLSVVLLACLGKALAQTTDTDTDTVSVVTLWAPDPVASVAGDSGTFTVFRHGDTNATLNVYYQIGGTASNGVDYTALSQWVTIPAGARTNVITVTPSNHGQTNVQTVVLQLASSPLANPVNAYAIGSPRQATVYIEGNGVTNLPPWVNIVSPTNGQSYFAPANIFILAPAGDVEGYVRTVQFFAGTNCLGVFTNAPPLPPGSPLPNVVILPQFSWTEVPVGNYALTAVATDNDGARSTSAPVNITVQEGPPRSTLPVVTIRATDPIASVSGGRGAFTVYRAGETNTTLNVHYQIGGTATNWLDYAGLSPWVTIPAGARTETIPITPFNHGPTNVHTVALQLTPSPWGGWVNYVIGSPSNATVYIEGTNMPPVVRIVSPANGSVFHAPINLPLFAYARDVDGFVDSVEFFAGTNSLGFGHRLPLPLPPPMPADGYPVPNPWPPIPPFSPTNLFELVWSNAPAGAYALTAVATDNSGASTISDPVNISILTAPPPPTNRPPVVTIVATDPVAIEGTNSWFWQGETNISPTWADWPPLHCRGFTNSGPKTATFMVRRWGDTNSNLIVPYEIGGTASNGVDYVALPGSVTLPAGARNALITIVPIDDGPPDVNKTVILDLVVKTTVPPQYLLGFPHRAAAVILDSAGPPPVTGMLPGRAFHLHETGPEAAWFCIESSTNLVHWTPVCTNQVIDGSIDFVDPDAPSHQARFYRVVPLTYPP